MFAGARERTSSRSPSWARASRSDARRTTAYGFPIAIARLGGMAIDKASPTSNATGQPGRSRSEQNRRTRIDRELPPQLKNWLVRVTRCHAHLCMIVRLYGNPEKAGGQSNEGEAYAARAARGDRTILFDALGVVNDTLAEIRTEIEREMDAAPTTQFLPGSPEKVDVLAERMARGDSLFLNGDAKMDVR